VKTRKVGKVEIANKSPHAHPNGLHGAPAARTGEAVAIRRFKQRASIRPTMFLGWQRVNTGGVLWVAREVVWFVRIPPIRHDAT
jgi:hypothetical protein